MYAIRDGSTWLSHFNTLSTLPNFYNISPPPLPSAPSFRIIIQASRNSYTEEGGKIYFVFQSKKQAKKPLLRKADISLTIPLILIKDCYAVRWYFFLFCHCCLELIKNDVKTWSLHGKWYSVKGDYFDFHFIWVGLALRNTFDIL